MRTFRIIYLSILAVVLLVVLVANAAPVQLKLLPEQFSGIYQQTVSVPLFLLMAVMVAVGFFLGLSWEYLREGKYRSEARHKRRDVAELKHEVDTLKKKMGHEDDEILAILK